MGKFSKFCFITIFIIFLVAVSSFIFSDNLLEPTADIYIEDNSVTCGISAYVENNDMIEKEICNFVLNELNNTNSDVDSIKKGVAEIGLKWGVENLNVVIDSSIGMDKIPVSFKVDGRSMVPTLQDGQSILVEKTKNISVNDIVVAESPQYGVIVKRVNKIDGNNVYLISDNKNIEYEEYNGMIYKTKGITTWVDISNIYGVVIS